MITMEAKRPGFSAASRSPIGPPQCVRDERRPADAQLGEKPLDQVDTCPVIGVPTDLGRLV